jgi:hypothetical protein
MEAPSFSVPPELRAKNWGARCLAQAEKRVSVNRPRYRDRFAPIVMTAPQVLGRLGPLAYAWRERHPSNPRWGDLEYLVYCSVNKPPFKRSLYSPAFRTRIQLDRALEAWHLEVKDALSQ